MERLPTKVIVISFGSYTYEFFLINTNDSFMFKNETFNFIQIPPYFKGDPNKLLGERVDLSSSDKKVGGEHSAIITFENN